MKGENFDYFTHLWYEKTEVNSVPQYTIDFDIVENRGVIFLRIGALNNVVLNNFDDSLPSKPVCKVIHTPINVNFWHCSLRWFCNDKDSTEMSKSERRRVLSAAKTFLIEHAYFDLPEHDAVEEIDFKKEARV